MNFKTVQDIAYTRLDEDLDDIDPTILAVVKNAVNEAYMLIATQIDKTIATVSATYTNKLVLPSDCYSSTRLEHSVYGLLSEADYEITANTIYIKNSDIKEGTITNSYIKIPTQLTSDDDLLLVKDMYCYAIASYATYVAFLTRKKLQEAQMALSEYNLFISGSTAQAKLVQK